MCPFLILNIPLCSLIHNAKHTALYEIRAPVLVVVGNCVVSTKAIQVQAAALLDWVAGEPAAEAGAVEAPLIGNEARLAVATLRAEAEGERVGKRLTVVFAVDCPVHVRFMAGGPKGGI